MEPESHLMFEISPRAGGIALLLATAADLDPLELARLEAFARTLKADPEAPRIVVEYGEEGRGSYLIDGVEVASSPTIHTISDVRP